MSDGDKLGETELYWEDAVVIAVYFAMVLAVGAWSSWRSKRDSVSGYFLASRSMHWIPVGASLFASNIGSGHFIGLSGSGASSGIGIAGFELNAMFVVLILGWFFVPVYMASGVYTMPEYLRKRFGGQRIRVYLSVLALMLYVFTKISADLYAGGIFINQAIRLDLYGSVLALLAVAGIFTMAGGLSAVMWTDFAQTILMLLGALALAILSISKVGGYSRLVADFPTAVPTNSTPVGGNQSTCSPGPPQDYMSLLRPPSDPQLPWTGMLLGLTVNAVWYWCSDQVIVQRALSARSLSHAKAGCLLAGYLKLLPLFLIVLPGMAARILFPDEVACSDPAKCKEICGSEIGCTNIAYPKLVLELMPRGARGLMMSVMLAALLSSLTSIFNSASTLFTMDIWRRWRGRKRVTETELLVVGRLFVLALVVASVAWIPVVQASQNSQLFHYIQSVTAFLAPPVCAVYVLALFCQRVNEQGAFWGLMCGLALGLVRFAWEFSYSVPGCASGLPDPRPDIISKVHYLHFGILLFLASCAVTVAVSYATDPIAERHLARLLFWNRHSTEPRTDITKKKKKGDIPVLDEGGKTNAAFREEEEDDQGNQVKKFREFADEIQPTTNGVPGEMARWQRALYCVCGASGSTNEEDAFSGAEGECPQAAADSIRETPAWRRACDAGALLLLVVGAFTWGYYA